MAEPLFPGYVFARMEAGLNPPHARETLFHALSTPGVVGMVRQQGRPAPVRDEEMEAVRRLVEGVTETRTLPETVHDFEPGDLVRW